MEVQIVSRLSDISETHWNSLREPGFPFNRYEHLRTLESTNCLGKRTGWLPQYILLKDPKGHILGATWFYEKSNSYGEFVFDHEWAELYDRLGLAYYPKAVCSIPFTPATGPKILVHPDADANQLMRSMGETLARTARKFQLSSQHILFISPAEKDVLADHYAIRTGLQFHWRNRGYATFDDFLSVLKKKKRKEIRYERRNIDDDLEILEMTGRDLSPQWADFAYSLYRKTNLEKMSFVCLTRGYFEEIFRVLSNHITFFVAVRKANKDPVAGSLFLHESGTLFGRYWGCIEERRYLHFELCYYRPIEWAIQRSYQLIEAGAQGVHKVSRGFLPVRTHSAHQFFQPQVQDVFQKFCIQEFQAIFQNLESYQEHLPYQDDNIIQDAGLF
jgi:predicted N-acyltransferase